MFFEQYKHEPAIAVVRFWVAIADGDPPSGVDIEARRAAGHTALDVCRTEPVAASRGARGGVTGQAVRRTPTSE
jgi:glutathione S-transferase